MSMTFPQVRIDQGLSATNASFVVSLTGGLPTQRVYTVTGPAAFIRFTSNGLGVGQGFTITYTSVIPTCNGTQTVLAPSGTLSPFTSGSYNDLMACSWLLTPAVTNAFALRWGSGFDVPSPDSVTIYAGSDNTAPLVGSYNNLALPSAITINSSTLFVQFSSDAAGTGTGFSLEFTALVGSAAVAPVISGFACSALGANVTGNAGVIQDHLGGGLYGDYLTCNWYLRPVDPTITYFKTVVTALSAERGYDILQFYSGAHALRQSVMLVTGFFPPRQYIVMSAPASMAWVTDINIDYFGWTVAYTGCNSTYCYPFPSPTASTIVSNGQGYNYNALRDFDFTLLAYIIPVALMGGIFLLRFAALFARCSCRKCRRCCSKSAQSSVIQVTPAQTPVAPAWNRASTATAAATVPDKKVQPKAKGGVTPVQPAISVDALYGQPVPSAGYPTAISSAATTTAVAVYPDDGDVVTQYVDPILSYPTAPLPVGMYPDAPPIPDPILGDPQ
eukprot:TRINITY_DN7455_c0_g1_i1.p1 TRINITY_DN7455_c0_g1~~TRINITY_DN7455_c0_g1_i1.p1  ORF type:complete len:502 (+),score=92.35 TRINITY_DN7455_c0_g1_i1:312-1817(+)